MGYIPTIISYIPQYILQPYIFSNISPIMSTKTMCWHTNIYIKQSKHRFSKIRLLSFDSPAPDYHLQKLLDSFSLLITYGVRTSILLQYSRFTISTFFTFTLTTVQHHKFQSLLHFTYIPPTYDHTYLRHSIHKNYLPPYV